jgi:glycosyltransferase involved in cell wall biosynthesis
LTSYPKVAFLPDTFLEVNGVAHTARHLEAFARRRQIPFLSVHCGPQTEKSSDGVVSVQHLKRSPFCIGLDANLDYDPFILRYAPKVLSEVRRFGAQLIHITGPGDMGLLGSYVAFALNLPLVISWHTNLSEYAAVRLERLLRFTGPAKSKALAAKAEKVSLEILRWFYRRAVVTMAPNQELVDLTHSLTGKPSFLMRRGVDTQLFNPCRRRQGERPFRLGYVGRLTPEKNVRFLAELGSALQAKGHKDFEFVLVGEGSEAAWLREHVPNATLTGVLRGDALATAYANMDLFVFPSLTDTFGNVVLEALASGAPVIVTARGGPQFLVEPGVTGYVAQDEAEFISCAEKILTDGALRAQMRQAAVAYAAEQSWDDVFESVFRVYAEGTRLSAAPHPAAPSLVSSRVR